MSLTEAIFARPSYSQMERLISAEEVKNRIKSAYVGTPLVASTAAGMTDTDRIYVYVGSETGYTAGNWYYYDGSAWTSGGVYNSTAFETDDTLTIPDAAADSKAVGDELSDLKNALTAAETAINAMEIVDNASGAIASFADGSDGVPVRDLKVQMEPIQAGSGDPSPDNVRPISGWTGCNVSRTGKNLLNNTATTITSKQVTFTVNTDGTVTANGTANDTAVLDIPFTFDIATDLIVSGCPSGGQITTGYSMIAATSGGVQVGSTDIGNGGTVSAADVSSVAKLQIIVRTGTTVNNLVFKPMVRYAFISDDTYEPYIGTVYPITFPSEAGTVYGGTLDVTTGVLTVDKTIITLDENTSFSGISADSHTFFVDDVLPEGNATKTSSTSPKFLCNQYKEANSISNTSQAPNKESGTLFNQNTFLRRIFIKNNNYSTAQSFAESLEGNNIQIVCPLPTALTYQCSPTEVRSLLGVNNIWADTGDSAVDYVADTKLYIEQLTEPDADMIADANITSGKYFLVGNSLYLATANIANGAAIVVGVNCTRTSLAEALNAINA